MISSNSSVLLSAIGIWVFIIGFITFGGSAIILNVFFNCEPNTIICDVNAIKDPQWWSEFNLLVALLFIGLIMAIAGFLIIKFIPIKNPSTTPETEHKEDQ